LYFIYELLHQLRSYLLPPATGELALPSRPAIHFQPVAPVPDGPGLNVRHQRLPRIELSPGDDDHVAVPAASAADQLRDAAAAGYAPCLLPGEPQLHAAILEERPDVRWRVL